MQLLGCCICRLRTIKILKLTDINKRAAQSNARITHCLHRALTRTDHRRVPCTQVQQLHELFARHVQLVLLLDHAVRHDVVHEQQADVVWQRVEKVRDVPLPPTAHLLHARARAHQRRALLVRAVPPCCTCVARCVHSPAGGLDPRPAPAARELSLDPRSTLARSTLVPRLSRASDHPRETVRLRPISL